MLGKRRVLLLDRDGTVNIERHYLSHPDQVELLPGAAAAIRDFNRRGHLVVLVTNQSGIGRGYFDSAMLEAIHARLRELLAVEGARLDGIFVCPHTPEDRCHCRKPRPGLVEQAAQALEFTPANSIVVGDKETDVTLGRTLGATTFLVRTGYGKKYEADTAADFVVDTLAGVVSAVIG